MDDLNRLLGETMRDAAERAPADDELLSAVHRRSDRIRRQRLSTRLSAVAALLAVGIPTGVTLLARPSTPAPSVATVAPPSPTDSPTASTAPSSSVTGSPSPTAGRATSAARSVLLAAGYPAPAFPYTLPATGGMRAPVASMADGDAVAFFEATELRQHADITVTVSSHKPAFTGSATETSMQVRGHPGTLRTVDVQPARQLTLYWRESATRWIRLATDDTYTAQQVVALADALTPASIVVSPPFRLDLSPAGFVTDTVTESTMSFRTSAGSPDADRFAVVLRKPHQLSGTPVTVGSYQAVLNRTAGGGVTLDVDVTDWNATLEVTVGSGLTISDADLLRFAAGVQILNRSNPK